MPSICAKHLPYLSITETFHVSQFLFLSLPTKTYGMTVQYIFIVIVGFYSVLQNEFRFSLSQLAIDLHASKPLISLGPITCTTYCFQGQGHCYITISIVFPANYKPCQNRPLTIDSSVCLIASEKKTSFTYLTTCQTWNSHRELRSLKPKVIHALI